MERTVGDPVLGALRPRQPPDRVWDAQLGDSGRLSCTAWCRNPLGSVVVGIRPTVRSQRRRRNASFPSWGVVVETCFDSVSCQYPRGNFGISLFFFCFSLICFVRGSSLHLVSPPCIDSIVALYLFIKRNKSLYQRLSRHGSRNAAEVNELHIACHSGSPYLSLQCGSEWLPPVFVSLLGRLINRQRFASYLFFCYFLLNFFFGKLPSFENCFH
jgi:hypothetical protein